MFCPNLGVISVGYIRLVCSHYIYLTPVPSQQVCMHALARVCNSKQLKLNAQLYITIMHANYIDNFIIAHGEQHIYALHICMHNIIARVRMCMHALKQTACCMQIYKINKINTLQFDFQKLET